jgi:hypothetical protein
MSRTASESRAVLSAAQHAAVFAGLVFAVAFVTTRVILDRSIDPLALLLGGVLSSVVTSAADRRSIAVFPVGAVIVVAGVVAAALIG